MITSTQIGVDQQAGPEMNIVEEVVYVFQRHLMFEDLCKQVVRTASRS